MSARAETSDNARNHTVPTQNDATVVNVMSALAMEMAINRWLKPKFESESGLRLNIDWRPTAALMKSIPTWPPRSSPPIKRRPIC